MTVTATSVECSRGSATAGDRSERRRYTVHGVVQGVGFRPFVWTLAYRHALAGTVCNTSGAVVIEVEGGSGRLDTFASDLVELAPPLSRIDEVTMVAVAPQDAADFVILESRGVEGAYQPISPDAATCSDCVRELFDPADRRHRYPFVNCTNCGPRFTIIEDVPYDRALTTMRHFDMCGPCAAEYADPADRRFHAQPNACPDCGPRAWLTDAAGVEASGDGVAAAAAALRAGSIVAVKGLGGFQLAVLAQDEGAVRRLRDRKHRPAKPLAVMTLDVDAARAFAHIDGVEGGAMVSSARPIVLLRRRDAGAAGAIAGSVAPGLDEIGVMLPSTPLHHLLLDLVRAPLVMTSGNVSDEPIAKDNHEAIVRLGAIADSFLLHDREIYARYDDSVVRIVDGVEHVVRRARGYCPLPVAVSTDATSPPVLALGAHLKNTFCILRDGRAFVGPHIGDLDHPQSLRHQDEALATYLRLFRTAPGVVAADLHPDYASTHIAERWWEEGAESVRVQHHHAHIASVMAEHRLQGRILGVAFDGTGFGEDGTIWGGELLLCDELDYQRVGHLAPVVQPGGDRCAREGWRMAIAYLQAAGLDEGHIPAWWPPGDDGPDDRRWRLVGRVAAAGGTAAAPVSTSAGRLFDAVASLLGVAHLSTFEASAAMRLEALARTCPSGSVAAIPVHQAGTPLVLDTPALVATLVEQRRAGRHVAEVAAVFHESLAGAVASACAGLASVTGVSRVALSGGVFQNALLLARTSALLRELSLSVFVNRAVPANDGGVSLGQAFVAASRARKRAHKRS
ncbi:MAG: carbamoyltransferase HypF [Candidatus Dormibacteraeota bacterium]|uniref:Carbamoyltransferase n=1 Tax=Candidatus Amunia macphersoniae TaxID=3127014 RepID=A0A934KHB4_9BACT|nr:carbamoyltransferase HypF [Candidatus Dormibacteraeota bacterium]